MRKVVIIGGGVAGLTAGRLLLDSGKFEVKLIEGAQRLGGRIDTRKMGDYNVELGAQWVHGETGNEVFRLANSMNLLLMDSTNVKLTSDSLYVTNNGEVIDKSIQDKISLVLGKILDGPEEDEIEGSVGDWILRRFKDDVHACFPPEDSALGAAALDWIHRFNLNIDGTDNWFQASLRGQHEYRECEGNPTVAWRHPSNFNTLLSVILTDLPEQLDPLQLPEWIELSKPVNRIEHLNTERDCVVVTCSDDTQYFADHVICTVSLGVLKSVHGFLFHPSLPKQKINAIENLGIGCVNKLHFDFQCSWWPDDIVGFNLLWEDTEDVEEYWRSDINEATLKKVVNGFPLWCRNILGFYCISSHPTALNSWISGPSARLIEQFDEDQVQDMFIKVLRKFVRNCDIPDPVGFCRSNWFSNIFTKGSYSFRQMDSEIHQAWASDLAEPIRDSKNSPVICFAGEATHSYFYSTVHGAYETGKREANRLINFASENDNDNV